MAKSIGRVRARLVRRQIIGGFGVAMALVAGLWLILPGIPEGPRQVLLTALLLLVGAAQIAFFVIDFRWRRWVKAERARRAAEEAAVPGQDL